MFFKRSRFYRVQSIVVVLEWEKQWFAWLNYVIIYNYIRRIIIIIRYDDMTIIQDEF